MDGWTYFERTWSKSATKCKPGSASATGSADILSQTECSVCPAHTYADRTQTKCEECPDGYTAPRGSEDIFACKRGVVNAQDPSKFFQVGEQWIGSYWCNGGKQGSTNVVDQGHGRLELYVTSSKPDGSLTILRKFQNSFTSGSYYMTAAQPPKLHDMFTLSLGEWADQPPDRTLEGGVQLVTKRLDLLGNISKMSDDKVAAPPPLFFFFCTTTFFLWFFLA